MFLGVFSSILPYALAAGFYLAYLLFSFCQPFISKAFQKEEQKDHKTVVYEATSVDSKTDKDFDFEDYKYEDADFQRIATHSPPIPHVSKEKLYSPPEKGFSSLFSPSLFSRPPPAC
jgi:hypothetical protein